MDASLWIGLLFLVLVLQPVARQRVLEFGRKRLLAQIEETRRSRVILLVHRQETMALLGIPVFRFIDVNDSVEVLRALHLTDPDVPVDLVLHTPGGLVLSALQIARAVKRHKGPVTVFVPHYAMSGGTLIALAADRIVMSEDAVLGPLDPQLGQTSAASVLAAVSQKPVEKVDDETLILADQAEKATRQLEDLVASLLVGRFSPERAQEVAALLTQGTWTHDYPITADAARELGLAVETEVPARIYELMALYPQPIRRQPSVEYTPGRRQSNPGSSPSARSAPPLA